MKRELTRELIKELKEKLKGINKNLAEIIVGKMVGKKQTECEKKLWVQKRKILAELNPLNN